MPGTIADMVRRQLGVLPTRWFGDNAPVLNAVQCGLGVAWVAIYNLIEFIVVQARLRTACGSFLDQTAFDFFGCRFLRWSAEPDASFRQRVECELFRPRATRQAVILGLTQLTSRAPIIFEPARPADTGGYRVGGVGYGVAGGWGNLYLPCQSFVTAFRPLGTGIAIIAGYGTGGPLAYGDLAEVECAITDSAIYKSVAELLPVGSIAWVNIRN